MRPAPRSSFHSPWSEGPTACASRPRRHPLVVSLGDIDFIIGASLQKESGIYLDGALAIEKKMMPVGMMVSIQSLDQEEIQKQNSLSLMEVEFGILLEMFMSGLIGMLTQ